MNKKLDSFEMHRRRLTGIAYRMLGTRADAEDVVQDTWLRWHATAGEEVRSAEAWLVSVTTRLCIDRLRSLRAERARYVGPWLPEPMIDAALEPVSDLPSSLPSPEQLVELASDVSVAFLAVLERLSPEERAAFLLHEVFDFDYADIADMLARNKAACRQLVHRAKTRVQQERPRVTVNRDAHKSLLDRFMDATRSGERTALQAPFATDAKFVADGGGRGAVRLEGIAWKRTHRTFLRSRCPAVRATPQLSPCTHQRRTGLAALLRWQARCRAQSDHQRRTHRSVLHRAQPRQTSAHRRDVTTGISIRHDTLQENSGGAVTNARADTSCTYVAHSCRCIAANGNERPDMTNAQHATPRLPYARLAPKALQALLGFSNAVKESSIGLQLVDLIYLRVSQINGCAYCTDLHWRDLIEQGVDARHLNSVAVWQESPFFSPRERAALAWVDALTQSQHELQDAVFARLQEHFAAQEIAEITLAIANMNAWNRIGVGMRLPISEGS